MSHAAQALASLGTNVTEAAEVLTLVDPGMRSTLALALDKDTRPYHARSVGEALSVVRERPMQAVLVGHSALSQDSLPSIGKLAGASAGILILVIRGQSTQPSGALLALGRYGVRDAVDVSTREGLTRLRSMVRQPEWEFTQRILTAFRDPLEASTDEMREYITRLIQWAPTVCSQKTVSARIGVLASTMNSRFFRVGLPSPKHYLAMIRLLYASGVLENKSLSIADAANRLHYSSPQSFIRHLGTTLGMQGTEFRRSCPFDTLVSHVRFRLLEAHAHVLKWFRPF